MIDTRKYPGLGAFGCECQNPSGLGDDPYWRGVWVNQGGGRALNPTNGAIGYITDSRYAQQQPGTPVPDEAVSMSLSQSVPGSGGSSTTIGEDIVSGFKSFFGTTTGVTKAVAADPLGGALMTAGISQLIPGFGAPPPPPPPSSSISPGMVLGGLALLGGVGLVVGLSSRRS